MGQLTQGTLAQKIDHTLLKPEATSADFKELCQEARDMNFFSVCIPPAFVTLAKSLLEDSTVKVCTVIGFPMGSNPTDFKVLETKQALQDGADEFDMVLNIGALKEKNYSLVESDIKAVVAAAAGKTTKVILEICLLSEDEIVKACQLSSSAGAQFVKTSTGFSTSGATVAAVRLMRQTVGHKLGVKASGGIRDYETLVKMVEAGANRIGTSSGVTLLKNGISQGGY